MDMLLAKKTQMMGTIMPVSMTPTHIPASRQQTTALATMTDMKMAMRKSLSWAMAKKNRFETKQDCKHER